MNEALESSEADTEPTDDTIESGNENELREETTVPPSEPEIEKKTGAVKDEHDNTIQFEGDSKLPIIEVKEVQMETNNMKTDNTGPNYVKNVTDESTELRTNSKQNTEGTPKRTKEARQNRAKRKEGGKSNNQLITERKDTHDERVKRETINHEVWPNIGTQWNL